MINEMNEISKHVGHDMLICNNDDILPVSEMPNTDLQRIVHDIPGSDEWKTCISKKENLVLISTALIK